MNKIVVKGIQKFANTGKKVIKAVKETQDVTFFIKILLTMKSLAIMIRKRSVQNLSVLDAKITISTLSTLS